MCRRVFTQKDATEAQVSMVNRLKAIDKLANEIKFEILSDRVPNAKVKTNNLIAEIENLQKELEVDIKIEAPKFEQTSF